MQLQTAIPTKLNLSSKLKNSLFSQMDSLAMGNRNAILTLNHNHMIAIHLTLRKMTPKTINKMP
jgi:hypothetical protein